VAPAEINPKSKIQNPKSIMYFAAGLDNCLSGQGHSGTKVMIQKRLSMKSSLISKTKGQWLSKLIHQPF